MSPIKARYTFPTTYACTFDTVSGPKAASSNANKPLEGADDSTKRMGPSGWVNVKDLSSMRQVVDPAAQGQGHSSKLLRRVNELADAENLPCYLFTTSVPGTSSKQVAIYSRFGYEKVEERTIGDATGTRGSVTCYAMVRKAKSPTA